MKLRLVVASLVAVGLMSSPLMAATKAKHRHHRRAANSRRLNSKYAAQEAFVLQNNAKSPVPSFDWTNRIHLSGYLNVDARFANRGPLGMVPIFSTSEESHEINVNNANVFIDAVINHCVNAHIGLAYVADSVNLFDTGLHTGADFSPLTESVRSDKGSVFAGGEMSVDEAFITVRDFANTPLYFRTGKMYLPFGVYHNPYPITYSLPQLLSQTRATAAELGFVTDFGLYGNVYVLDGGQSASAFSETIFDGVKQGRMYSHRDQKNDCYPFTCLNNYGVTLGYAGCYTVNTTCSPAFSFHYHVNAGYLKDIRDVSYLTDLQDLMALGFHSKKANIKGPNGFGMKQAGAVALHGDLGFYAWHFSANYVSALCNIVRDPENYHDRCTETRAWAADITGVYDNRCYGYNTVTSLSYQWSRQAGGIMPKWRLQADVSAEIFYNTSLTFEYVYSQDYDRGECDNFGQFINYQSSGYRNDDQVVGGTCHTHNQAALRLGVVF